MRMFLKTCFQVGLPLINPALCLSLSLPGPSCVTHTWGIVRAQVCLGGPAPLPRQAAASYL